MNTKCIRVGSRWTLKWRFVSIGMLLQSGLLVPAAGLAQVDSLIDSFPLSVGNQWTYAFNHERVEDNGAGFVTTTDTGMVSYRVLSKTEFTDSLAWAFRESRSLRHRVRVGPVTTIDSLVADSTIFDVIEFTAGRHQLHRRITDQGVLWATVVPFMRDMGDTTRMYRYWRVDSSLTHVFVIRYPSPSPLVSYRFTVARDSGMVSVSVSNAITMMGYEHGNHHLVARTLTGVGNDPASTLPRTVVLEQNYPNPFNPVTNLQFSIANGQSAGGETRPDVSGRLTILKVYDVLGREVATLVNEVKQPGRYAVQFDGGGLASGVYFYKIQAGNFVASKKLLLLK